MAEKHDQLKIEKEIMDFWKENNIYDTIRNRNRNGKKFYFLDGPPYTSGKVHLGTAWNKSLKDAVLRYKRMTGHDVWDRAGYDMHGLPTEHATEKKLGLSGKGDIEKYGISGFVGECIKLCTENMKSMNQDFSRLGVWMDFDNAYQSIASEFIDGEWWLIKRVHENKRLYRGLRTMTWCKDCATALAKHELEYETVTDKSIFVKFRVAGTENEYLIVWTTTPWTIPFNMAIMANPDLEYMKARVGDEVWILSKDIGPMAISSAIGRQFQEIGVLRGNALEGLKYVHFFDGDMGYASLSPSAQNPGRMHTVIMSSEYVDTSAGTGLVHCAPGCGPEDYEVGHRNGIPAFNTLSESGVFPESSGRFSGLVAKKDDEKFIDFIDKAGALLATADVEHDYAHCWRCHNPVIYRTTRQWFFRVEDLKPDMIRENDKIKWVPSSAYNAFNSWLSNLRDNSISKQRYWGTPIPIWVNEKDDEDYIVIGSVKELENLSLAKIQDVKGLHIPEIDLITISRDGKTYRRVPDILDVWVDAGTASWNCLGFPHRTDLMESLYPAEFILEGKDQIRGWFNLLHVASMVSMNRPSFKNVYMHGFIQDSQGRKMSKSLGNYILPEEIIGKYGADTFRYYFIGGANPGLDINYNPDDVELRFKNLGVLWNLHNLLIDMQKSSHIPATGLEVSDNEIAEMGEEELYMLSFMNRKIREATLAFEAYRINEVPGIIESLFLELSRGYVQLVREKSVQGTDKEKKDIAYVISNVLLNTIRMFSTICPFISEKIYNNIKGLCISRSENSGQSEQSVHMLSWPSYNAKMINDSLEAGMANAYSIIQGVLFAREKAQLGVRWPVQEVTVVTRSEEARKAVKSLGALIQRQVNAKHISVAGEMKGVNIRFAPEPGKIGKTFGIRSKKIIQELVKQDAFAVINALERNGKFVLKADGRECEILAEHIVIERSVPGHLQEAEFKLGLVYLDKTRTSELEVEGYARELIRRIQALRKNAGLEKSQTIELFLRLPGRFVVPMAGHEKAIKLVTGALGIMMSANSPDPVKSYEVKSVEKIKGNEFEIYFSRVNQA